MNDHTAAEQALKEAALRYHEAPTPGKLAIRVTKPMATQRDLSLAYSPGVAEACLQIHRDARGPNADRIHAEDVAEMLGFLRSWSSQLES